MNATSDAPGANDDASGMAAVIEAARVLSKHRFPATLVFAVLSGEEQGLYGGHVLADYATKQGWRVEADLNNDIVGNSEGINGVRETTRVRVFSEGTKTRGDRRRGRQAPLQRRRGRQPVAPARPLSWTAWPTAIWATSRSPWSTAPTASAAAATRWRC